MRFSIKRWVACRLIDIYCRQALKYQQRIDMLNMIHGLNYLYAIARNVEKRNRWLVRIVKIQRLTGMQ